MAKRMSRLKTIPAITATRGWHPPLRPWPTRNSSPAASWPWYCPCPLLLGWLGKAFRKMLATMNTQDMDSSKHCRRGRDSLSFSSDTGMAECLVVARKLEPDETPAGPAFHVATAAGPKGLLTPARWRAGCWTAASQAALRTGRMVGTPLQWGEEIAGHNHRLAVKNGEAGAPVRLPTTPSPNRLCPIQSKTVASWQPVQWG